MHGRGITIDGSRGEGGGQIVRTSLALAAATGTPVTVTNVRANRPKPGLRPQHVTATEALVAVTDARVDGAHVGSTAVSFRPGPVVGGDFAFNVGTAGSVTLVLQALLPACAASRQAFAFTLMGGTDVPFAPTWDHFARVHAPTLAGLGIDVDARVVKHGFFPAGGGEVHVTVDGAGLRTGDFLTRGPVRRIDGHVIAHGLKKAVADRGAEGLADGLARAGHPGAVVDVEIHRGPGRGFALAAWASCANVTLGADAVGERGVSAEEVAARAAGALAVDLASGAAVDTHEADALPVFLALAGGGAFTTRAVTPHARTVLDLLPEFLPVEAVVEPAEGGSRVTIHRTGSA